MNPPENIEIRLRRLRKFLRNPLKLLSEGIMRKLRRLGVKPLKFFAKVCEAKVPHTPYALRARENARQRMVRGLARRCRLMSRLARSVDPSMKREMRARRSYMAAETLGQHTGSKILAPFENVR